MICKTCKGTKIKSRTNYTHGRNSKSRTVLICKKCGSTDIEAEKQRWRRPRR